MAGNQDTHGPVGMLTNVTIQMLDFMLAEAVMHENQHKPSEAKDQSGHIQRIRNLAAAARIVTLAIAGLLRAETLIVNVITDQRREAGQGLPLGFGPWGAMQDEGMDDDEFGAAPQGPDASGDRPEIFERKRAALYREMVAILEGKGICADAGRSDAHECPDLSLEPDGASASDRG